MILTPSIYKRPCPKKFPGHGSIVMCPNHVYSTLFFHDLQIIPANFIKISVYFLFVKLHIVKFFINATLA